VPLTDRVTASSDYRDIDVGSALLRRYNSPVRPNPSRLSHPGRVTAEQARRIAVCAQLLDGPATDVLDTVRRVGYLQLDPTNRVARSHLLVLRNRGSPA